MADNQDLQQLLREQAATTTAITNMAAGVNALVNISKAEKTAAEKARLAALQKDRKSQVSTGKLLGKAGKALGDSVKAMKGLVPTIAKIGMLFAAFKNPEALAKAFSGIGRAVGDLAKQLNNEGTKKGIGNIIKFLGIVGEFAIDRVTQTFKGIGELADGKTFEGIKNILLGFSGLRLVTNPIGVIKGTIGMLFKIVKVLSSGEVLKTVKDIGTGFGKNLKTVMKGFGRLGTFIDDAAKMLGSAGGGLGKFLGKFASKGGGGIFAGIFSGLFTFLETGDVWKSLFAGGGASIGAAAGGVLGSFLGPVGTAIGAALGGFLGDFLGKWFSDRFRPALEPFLGFLGAASDVLGKVSGFVGGVFLGMFERFQGQFEELGVALQPLANLILPAFGEALNVIKTQFGQVADFVGNIFKKIGSAVAGVFGGVGKTLGGIAEGLANLTGSFYNMVTDMLTKIANFIPGMDLVRTWVQVSLICSHPSVTSPLRLMHSTLLWVFRPVVVFLVVEVVTRFLQCSNQVSTSLTVMPPVQSVSMY